jgi:hypothetical protein
MAGKEDLVGFAAGKDALAERQHPADALVALHVGHDDRSLHALAELRRDLVEVGSCPLRELGDRHHALDPR